MKKVLIGGCSFSAGGLNQYHIWSEQLKDSKLVEVKNVARGSYGQGLITQTVVDELIQSDFDYDFVIVQFSAISRSVGGNLDEVLKKIHNNPNEDVSEYYSNINDIYNKDRNNFVSDKYSKLESSYYKSSLLKIAFLKDFLENRKIPHLFFWGWQQIDDKVYKEHKKIIDYVYDSDNWWSFEIFGGINEFNKFHLGEKEAVLSSDDFHPSKEGHKNFYRKVIRPKIMEII